MNTTPAAAPDCYIGLMSGTSLDGVDGVVAEFGADGLAVCAHAGAAFPPALRAELLALNTPAGVDELHRASLAANGLTRVYADVVAQLLAHTGLDAAAIRAIGAHGQTVRHRPGAFDGTGYTLQLNNPGLLAELTGIAVAADFRSRDVAAGGQGAPLVPAFHAAVFGRAGEARAALNLGGIANLSLLPGDGTPVRGFDCGPANALLDHWCQLHRGQPFDADGAWAATGTVREALLQRLLAEPYFAQPIPKSTGRDLFHPDWLAQRLDDADRAADPADVQATLAELTARSSAEALRTYATATRRLIVCGGGAFNGDLLRRLARHLPDVAIDSSADHGLPPQQVEAAAFAWLARQLVNGAPGNLPAVTGAHGLRVLGALYPA